MRIQLGVKLTVPKIVIVVIATFLLVLFQNLPADVIPTVAQLYHATVIAAVVALLLILQYEGNAPLVTPFAGSE
jgi:uncharacterized membrane protein